MADQDELSWIAAARRGDRNAFGRLVQAYQVPVYNLAYRMLGNPTEAEDAAQETFLRAYARLNTYQPEMKFSNWILSIASHHCIDRLRRKRPVILSLESLLPEQDAPDRHPGPESQTYRKQQQEEVQQLLQVLGWEERSMIVMRYWHDMSYEEIAHALRVSVGAVKSRLHRARKTLAGHWPVGRLSSTQTGGVYE